MANVSTHIDIVSQLKTELNPKIWNNKKLKSGIRSQLLKIADSFMDEFGDIKLPVYDVIFTGSLCNYNWTQFSDIDLHIVLDFTTKDVKQLKMIDVSDYFDTKRKLWNERFKVEVLGFPVEVYIQLKDEDHHSTGVFSVKHNKWTLEPSREKFDVDKVNKYVALSKVKSIEKQIYELIDRNVVEPTEVEKLIDKIWDMRQKGLNEDGEFSTNN